MICVADVKEVVVPKAQPVKIFQKLFTTRFFSNLVKIVEVVWHILTLVKILVLKIVYFSGNFQHLQLRAQIKS